MTQDGRGKFSLREYKKPPTSSLPELRPKSPTAESVRFEEPASEGAYTIPEEISAVSINASLQSITHTYSPLVLATLTSLGHRTSVRLVKLAGQSSWHTHDHTDEVFILLRGTITVLYKTASGQEKSCKAIGGELLSVPMGMEHTVIADDGTEVLLLEGCQDNLE